MSADIKPGANGPQDMNTGSASPVLLIRDPQHIEAHRNEFFDGPEKAIALAQRAILVRKPQIGLWECFAVRCDKPVGQGGLRRIWPWTKGDYWARRPGRSIASHLIRGKRKPTRFLCIWGFWQDEASFVLHTLYPGVPAPREIHDPELDPADLPASLRFWTRHAIIVGEP